MSAWKYPPRRPQRDSMSPLATLLLTAIAVLVALWAIDAAWTVITAPVGVIWE